MAEILIEALSAAGEIFIWVVSWLYPDENPTTFRVAAGCLVFVAGMTLVAVFLVLLLVNLALK